MIIADTNDSNIYITCNCNKSNYAENTILKNLSESAATAYTFNGGELITIFNNNMNLLNVRNDYSIWGNRISASGATLPIHMRYAIDMKPNYYHPITVTEEEISSYNEKYGTSLKP